MVCQTYPAGLSKTGQPVAQFGSAGHSLASVALVWLNHHLPCRVPNSESVIAVITVATSWLNLGIETGLYMQPHSPFNPQCNGA